jgi:Sulfotransferase family
VQLVSTDRDRAPVFVIGSARSGTTLLYHTLLSSGLFPIYLGEPAVFDLLRPKFGDLQRRSNRERLMKCWLRSSMYRISNLDGGMIQDQVLNHCQSAGEFLRLVMEEVARLQGKTRWAVWGPDNLLYMRQIKKEIPDALFIHMIRDGRDVAISMNKEGWIRPLPWDRKQGLVAAALHWKWKVSHGIQAGRGLGADYREIRFEELLDRRTDVLRKLGSFIGQELKPDQIKQGSLGTLLDPNTSFQEEHHSPEFSPVERWRRLLSESELAAVESTIGPLLRHLGYKLAAKPSGDRAFRNRVMNQVYPRYFDIKLWLKANTILGMLTSTDRMKLSQ